MRGVVSNMRIARGIGRYLARHKLRGCDRIGTSLVVVGSPFVENLGRIEIGREFRIEASPVVTHLVTGASGAIRIGDRVALGHGVAICSHASIEIGDDTTLEAFVIVLDADFQAGKARDVPADPRPVRIGRNVRIGAGTMILRGAVIGDGVTIAPNSVVSRWLPPGVRAAGVPARPLRPLERPRV